MRVHDLAGAEYVAVGTRRRNGDLVHTAVWAAELDGRLVFVTDAESWKVRRLRADPAVEVAACTRAGEILSGAAVLFGTGEILEGRDASKAEKAVRKKYGWKWRTFRLGSRAAARVTSRPDDGERVAVALRLDGFGDGDAE